MTQAQINAIWIGVLALAAWFAVYSSRKSFATRAILQMSDNGKTMVANAKKLGAIAFRKNSGNTFVLCLAKDFLEDYNKVREARPYSMELIKVRSTFTFWKDEYCSNPFHLASTETAKKWLDDMVYLATGFWENEVDQASFEESIDILIPANSRLYVPFLQKGDPDKDDLEFYNVPKEFVLDAAKREERMISVETYLKSTVRRAANRQK